MMFNKERAAGAVTYYVRTNDIIYNNDIII